MIPESSRIRVVLGPEDTGSGLLLEQAENGLALAPLAMLAGLLFLMPAVAAIRLGRVWHAVIFVITAMLSFIHEAMDCSMLPSSLAHVLAKGPLHQWVRLLDYGSLYFCLLQLGFVVSGPEDPTVHSEYRGAAIAGVPMDVIVIRLGSVVAMLVFLSTRTSWLDFHWQIWIFLEVVWLSGFSFFWLHPRRRLFATEVLLRTRFWLRIWKAAVLPLATLTTLLVALSSAAKDVVPVACRTVLAGLSVRTIDIIAQGGQGDALRESQRLQEAQGLSPSWNPAVAQHLLAAPGVLGVPTIIASLVAHAACGAAWHWPLLSRPADFRPGGYLVVLGLIPALATHVAAFALIGATRPCIAFECEDSTLAKQIGCIMGYTSITCGFITALLQGSTPSLVLTMCLMVFAMTALAAGSAPLTAGRRCLCFSTFLSDAVLVGFVVLLLLEQHLITIKYRIPQAIFALAEYSSFAVYLLWPLAWRKEVRDEWQMHKVWRVSKPIQMA
ncbi:unnamed protein product [Symbiodinium sp. CCMP2592]|nr:unnamed protein product [Symbiodinium sp. CCMP2592]